MMKSIYGSVAVAFAAFFTLAGCSSGPQQPPAHADMHALGTPPPPPFPSGHVWSKADKIAAVNKAPISDAQKQAEIAKINAGSGN
jgi:hypothetical protein